MKKGREKMYIALDEFGQIIDIDQAQKGNKYYCPVCHAFLIIREGKINAKHFAHEAESCTDNWHYDMSEWHRKMQGYFDIKNREVIIKKGEKIHRADIMVGNIVIEFQHSPITAEEFAKRNAFFADTGKRIVWVFDVSEQFRNHTIDYADNSDTSYIWKNPLRIFSTGDKITDYSKKYAVWLYWVEDDYEFIQKIIWTAEDEYGFPSLRRFIVSNYFIELEEMGTIDPKTFFYSKQDYFLDELSILKNKYTYKIKYSGESGKSRDSYICPLRKDKFGIQLFGENSCVYCRYCYMIVKKERYHKKKWAVYCCYPQQCRELSADYLLCGDCFGECIEADIYQI